jgi:hypothetical protein
MPQKNMLPLLAYFVFLCLLILMMPPYGDPAVVIWTSKVMSVTGFPYDPFCSKNISRSELVLCVRSPLYYSLLAMSDGFYKVIPMILTGLFFIFQIILASYNGLSLSVFALMFPSIYLLFSRTYVDSLTATLSTLMLIALIKANTNSSKHYSILLFLTPMLLILTRESSSALPLLLLIIYLIKPEFRNKKLLTLFFGWITGLIIWQLYVKMSGGLSYSDFQPHLPTLEEFYRAAITTLTPILPWEIRSEDLQAYFIPTTYAPLITNLAVIIVILLGLTSLIPMITSLIHYKQVDRLILGQVIFGIAAAGGLLFLKGDIDFFRHLAYLLPATPLLIEVGIKNIQRHTRVGATMIKISFILMLILYFSRTVRLFASGYQFDACQYLLKRQEISTVQYFYETACS